jgi:phosphonate transport system substrate-binding protein
MKKLITIILLIFCVGYSASSSAGGTPRKKAGTTKKKTLVLAISDNGSGSRLAAITPIAAYLSKELNMHVKADTVKRAKGIVEGIEKATIDIAYINNFGYIVAKQDNAPINLLVMTGKENGNPGSYNSCIISARSKNINSLEELVAGSKNFSFMFVDAASASGHLVPRLYLTKLGIPQAESRFKDILFGNNHDATILKIANGEADAGSVAYNILLQAINQGTINKNDINILWVSEPISQTPMIVSNKLSARLQANIQKAMLNMHKKDPALWEHVQKSFSARDASNYVIAKDEHYNSIREISGNIDDLIFILNYYMD